MRICLLTTQDLDADPFPEDDWPCDPRPFLLDHDWTVETLVDKASSPGRVDELVDAGFDLFFNLCDGAADQDLPGIEVVETLERRCVPFVGAISTCYEPTRIQMKEACRRVGVSSPNYVMVECEADIARAAATLRFPLFVKHHSSYASVDLSRRSRVRTPAGLEIQAKKILRRHGAALVEEFVEGIECTVLVSENPEDSANPWTYMPVQYAFPKGESFKHADMKWVEYDRLETVPVADPELARRLRRESAAFFLAIGAASFARCDMRIDRDGRIQMLEINPNCGVYYPETDPGSADLCLKLDPGGHVAFTERLVGAALARHGRRLDASSAGRT